MEDLSCSSYLAGPKKAVVVSDPLPDRNANEPSYDIVLEYGNPSRYAIGFSKRPIPKGSTIDIWVDESGEVHTNLDIVPLAVKHGKYRSSSQPLCNTTSPVALTASVSAFVANLIVGWFLYHQNLRVAGGVVVVALGCQVLSMFFLPKLIDPFMSVHG